jgi:hypothetical protein
MPVCAVCGVAFMEGESYACERKSAFRLTQLPLWIMAVFGIFLTGFLALIVFLLIYIFFSSVLKICRREIVASADAGRLGTVETGVGAAADSVGILMVT